MARTTTKTLEEQRQSRLELYKKYHNSEKGKETRRKLQRTKHHKEVTKLYRAKNREHLLEMERKRKYKLRALLGVRIKTTRICSVSDCNRKHSGKGYCYYHYVKLVPEIREYYKILNKKTLKQRRRKSYLKNRKKVLKDTKLYKKNHPEQYLQYFNKYNKKLGKKLNMTGYVYKMALLTWSKSVRKRDNNVCQICGKFSGIAHHILYKAKIPELSLNINNGITICQDCHYEVHCKRLNLLIR